MADPVGVEQVERFGDVAGRPGFAGVDGFSQTPLFGELESFLVPAGRFAIRGNLVVPGGVTLSGTFTAPPTNRHDGRPDYHGSVLLAYAGRGEPDAKPFIRLGGNMATVKGLIITYPEWKQSDVPPMPYPPCILGRGYDNMAYLKLSEGVGAGLVLDGKLFHGGRAGTAGEIGHTTVDEYGAVCRCGNRGCLETLVAARAVTGLLEPVRGADLTITDVVERAERGDAACRRVLADTGRQTGVALANLCNLLNPERVVIGGELAIAGELLLAPMREIVGRYAIPSAVSTLDIVLGSLGPNAHVLGAVALALRGQTRLVTS